LSILKKIARRILFSWVEIAIDVLPPEDLSHNQEKWAAWIVRKGAPNNDVSMPLASAISSDRTLAPFFDGRSTSIMRGSFITDDCRIGGHCYIGFNCFITRTKLGRYVSIANNVSIGPGEHPVDLLSTSSIFYDLAYDQLAHLDCVIENDVWIGEGCIIRRGVTIGNGAIIGANSFVNQDVEPFSVVAGSPARVIKYRFDDVTITKIMESKWWELEPDEARKVLAQLQISIELGSSTTSA
jgi:acetyltransferase-like isoleucine patch superfamily enzyme